MRIALITVGDTRRLTGGYLYHARLLDGLRRRGDTVDELSPAGAGLDQQLAAAADWGGRWDMTGYDVVVVDALARGLVAQHADRWRALKPLIVLVHQLASEAEPSGRPEDPTALPIRPEDGAAERAVEHGLEAPLLRADRLVAVSRHGRELLLARGVPVERISIVSPGFDRLPVPFSASPRLGGPTRVLCVAQWIPRKGIADLVAAWTRLNAPGAVLELIGEAGADRAYADRVYAAIRAAPDSIRVRGTVSDDELQRAYLVADVFALPTRFEGYGMVFAEALAFGLPVIACGVGPLPELLGPEAALLTQPGDVPALAEALDGLVGDHDLRHRMAAAARRRAKELPAWGDTVREFREVLVGVTGR